MQVQTNQQLPVSFRYDVQGRISQRISHQEESTPDLIRRWFYHDSSPRPARIQWEDGTSSQFEYDVEGNLVSTVNPAGHSERYQYGAFDKLIQSTDPLGASTFYFYNKEGEFSGVANSQKQQWRYQFNKAGQITEEQHYDGRVTRFEYDAVGRLIARIQPDGSQQQFKYDAAGRLLEKQNIAPDQVPTSLTQFEYNPAGQLIRAANPHSEIAFEYDAAGQLIKELLNGEEVAHEYNGDGERTQLISEAVQLAFGWQQGQLTQLQVNEHSPLQIQRNRMGHELGRTNQAGFNLKQQWGKDGWFHQWLDNDTPHDHDQARSPVQGTAPSGPGHRSRFRQLQRSYLYNSLDQIVAIDESHWGASLFEHNANGQITRQMRRKPFDGSPMK